MSKLKVISNSFFKDARATGLNLCSGLSAFRTNRRPPFFEGIFSYNNFYALSFCKESIVLLPFSAYWPDVKKKVALELPFSSIRGVEVSESGLDYRIDIQLDNEVISLMTQQAELSAHRASGCLSIEDYTFVHNWHTKNLKGTLQALQGLGC